MSEASTVESAPSAPSSHGDIVASLSSGMAALTASVDPKTPAAQTELIASATPAGSPPALSGSPDPRTPPTAAAADPDADLSVTPVNGAIPLADHKRVLETTRKKVETATRERYEQEYAPWQRLKSAFTPDEFAQIAPTLKTLASNPGQFLQDTAAELGYRLVPIGQTPDVPRGMISAPADEPQPDMQLQDGTLLFSAAQQAKHAAWLRDQLRGDVTKELQPFRDQQKQQEIQQARAQIDARAITNYQKVAKREGFEELKPRILDKMRGDKSLRLEEAYLDAYDEHYRPSRDTKIRQTVLDEMNHKGRAASSSLTPTRRATTDGGAIAPQSTADLLRQNAAAMGVTL